GNKTTNLTSKEAKMGKVMRHTLGASLNIRHNLSSSKGPKPLQLKLLTTYIPKTSAFTLAFIDAVIHLLMEAKHWGLRKSRNATSLNSRFKSLDTLKVKIISVTFRRVIRTNHKKASKIWRHENIQLGGCQS